jgi:transcriptional regulator with PAS, ATPase and Fis domain
MLDSASDLVFGPVFDTVDIGLVVLDAQGYIVGWNEWIARVSRRQARDVLGKTLLEVFPEVQGTRLPEVIDDSFRAGSSSILTHTLNELLPLKAKAENRCFTALLYARCPPRRRNIACCKSPM